MASHDDDKDITDCSNSCSVLPKQNCEYGSREYWEDRFSKESDYEWLLSYERLASQLSKYLSRDSRILIVGCGNAPFSADLYDAGYTHTVNIDYSTQVIARMREQHVLLRPQMQWLDMDMTNLSFEDASFDAVIDKAAMDAMLANEGDVWNPNDESIRMGCNACRSISRVLKPGGVFLQVSLVQPHFRNKYLLGSYCSASDTSATSSTDTSYSSEFGWSLDVEQAGDAVSNSSFGHYLYVMRKQASPEPTDLRI
jgi:SAM-dependent methyltransferase